MTTSKNRMTIHGKETVIGGMALSFHRNKRDSPPDASIDIWCETEDELGGAALNCLHIGDVPSVDKLQGMRFSFDDQLEEGTEIRESVFMAPASEETLEISKVVISFGSIQDDYIEIDIEAECFDSKVTGIPVSITAFARIAQQ
jgi:hypothetical protein